MNPAFLVASRIATSCLAASLAMSASGISSVAEWVLATSYGTYGPRHLPFILLVDFRGATLVHFDDASIVFVAMVGQSLIDIDEIVSFMITLL